MSIYLTTTVGGTSHESETAIQIPLNFSSKNITDVLLQADPSVVGLVANFQGILSALSLLLFVGFTVFILYTSDHFKILFSRKNLLLSCLFLATAATFGATAAHTLYPGRATSVARAITQAIAEILYLWYSFDRCSDVLRLQSSRLVYTGFRFVFGITIVSLIVPIFVSIAVPVYAVALYWTRRVSVVSAMGAIALDSFLVFTCVRYLYIRTAEITELKGAHAKGTQFYPVVARHTIVSSIASFCTLAFYVGGLVILSRMETLTDAYTYYLMQMLSNCSILFVISTLLVMKIRLVNLATVGRK